MSKENIGFNSYAISDKGKRRERNEDAYICDPKKAVFLVADGMGGENYGEVASQLTAEHFLRLITPFILDEEATIPFEHANGEDVFAGAVHHVIKATNAVVAGFAEENESHRGMGSTLTAAVYHENNLYVAHVGDSRLYRIREETIQQITQDHTRVQEMVRKNLLSPGEAKNHPQRHILTRCVGRKRHPKADIFSFDFSEEDIFLLCSDGLYEMVDDDDILRIVVESDTLALAGNRLVETANQNGGKDNITVVLFRSVTRNIE